MRGEYQYRVTQKGEFFYAQKKHRDHKLWFSFSNSRTEAGAVEDVELLIRIDTKPKDIEKVIRTWE